MKILEEKLSSLCRLGEKEKVDEFISENELNFDLTLPLLAAAENGHIGIVKALIAHGAEPNSEVLYWAVVYEHDDIADLLIAHGAKITPEITRMRAKQAWDRKAKTQNN